MKNKGLNIFLIVLLSIISISIIAFMTLLLTDNIKIKNFAFRYKVNNELVVDTNFDNNFKKIDIDSKSSNIYIKATDDDNVRVVIYGDKDEIKYSTDNDILKIETNEKSCIGFCFNLTVSKVEVYLPRNYENKILINDDYGDIEVDEFIKSTIDINNSCGDVNVLGGNVVNIYNDYGDIELGFANKANIKEDCGDIKIDEVNDIKAENNLGNIEIRKINKYLDIANACGDIKIDKVNIIKDSYIKDDLGDINIGNTNEIYIDAKTDLGDIDINKNYHKADNILKIQNNCGDIEVNN